MELSHKQSRSSISSLSLHNKEQKPQLHGFALADLLTCKIAPFHDEAHIVFRTTNLTKYQNLESSSPKGKPCLFTSIILSFSDHDHNTLSPVANMLLQEEADQCFTIAPNLLPQTTCHKHGNVGFLPLNNVRALSEYDACANIRQCLVQKVVHKVGDCILMFPHDTHRNANYARPLYRYKDVHAYRFLKHCYQCLKNLEETQDIFFYRDKSFCSVHCRYAGHVAHSLREIKR